MDSACSGYPESTPNFLHNDAPVILHTIQLITLHPQYPLDLLLLLLLLRSIFNTQKRKRRNGHKLIERQCDRMRKSYGPDRHKLKLDEVHRLSSFQE
jgi:hypothetical protein